MVFVSTLIDATGLPFPGRILLVAAGALAGAGRRNLFVIIALGALAAVAMDHVWYIAGRRGSRRVLDIYRRLAGSSGEAAATDYFKRYGAATIVLGRFSTGVRALAWPVAAAHGIGYTKFLLVDLFAAALWSALWVLLGWAVGDRWRPVAEEAGLWVTVAGIVAAALVATPLAMRMWRRRARRRGARRS